MRIIEHRIGGRATAGTSTRRSPVFDPATGLQPAQVALAGSKDVDTAVDAAREAFEAWSQASVTRRARVMFKLRDLVERHEDDLARLIVGEHGKVLDDARGEVVRGREVIEYACGVPSLLKGDFSDRVSTGVDTFDGDKAAVDALLDHREVAAVSFVGSTPIARYVHERASQAGKRVQALGGAKNHAVVLPDADVDDAARQITAAAYGSAGQRCMAISVVVAVGEIADVLVDRLADLAGRIRVGPGGQPDSQMGPVVTADAKRRISGYVTQGVEAGARLVVDGRAVPDGPGFFLKPSLFDKATVDMPIYRDEIFGPVLVVVPAQTLAEAIGLVNANPYGNGVALFSAGGAAAREFQRSVRVGMIGINVPIPVPMAFYSFGGWKACCSATRTFTGLRVFRSTPRPRSSPPAGRGPRRVTRHICISPRPSRPITPHARPPSPAGPGARLWRRTRQ